MTKRRTAGQIQQLLKEAACDLANGLTIADVCRKLGIAQNTFYRWRQRHHPAQIDDARRVRELTSEVERLKLLVAELMLDKQMLQDVAKKSGDAHPAAGCGRLPHRTLRDLAAARGSAARPGPLDLALPPQGPAGQRGPAQGGPPVGAAAPPLRPPADPRAAAGPGLVAISGSISQA